MKSKHFLNLGWFIPLLFLSILIICGFLVEEYNHLEWLVSELGTSGSPAFFLFNFGLAGCAILCLLFIKGLIGACKKRELALFPAYILLAFPISLTGAALFPLPHPLHGTMGSPSFLLFLSPITAFVFWKKTGIRKVAMISLLIMALGFLIYTPQIFPGLIGLKQRFFHLGWMFWFTSLSVIMLNNQKAGITVTLPYRS